MMNVGRRELKRFQVWYNTQPEAKELRNPFLRMEDKEKILEALYKRFQEENNEAK